MRIAVPRRNTHGRNLLQQIFELFLLFLFLPSLTISQYQSNETMKLPLFDNSSVSYRNDLCDQYVNFALNRDRSLKHALKGVAISSFITLSGLTIVEERETNRLNSEYAGLIPEIMDELCRRAKCTWRDTFVIGNSLPNGINWTDLAHWATDKYDLALDWWTPTTKRMAKGIAFSNGWYESDGIMLTKKSNKGDILNTSGLLQPFENEVWFTILATIIGTCIAYIVMKKLDPEMDKSAQTSPELIFGRLFETVMGNFQLRPGNISGRILAISMTLFSLFFVANYTANLTTFLVFEHRPKGYLIDVASGIRKGYKFCSWENTGMDEEFKKKFPEARKIMKNSEEEIFAAVLKGECEVGLVSQSGWNVKRNNYTLTGGCNLEWQGRPFMSNMAGFAMKADAGEKCTSLLQHSMNLHLIDMKNEGFIEIAWYNFATRTNGDECSQKQREEVVSERLSLEKMSMIFILHCILVVIALLCSVTNYLSNKNDIKNSKRDLEEARTITLSENEPLTIGNDFTLSDDLPAVSKKDTSVEMHLVEINQNILKIMKKLESHRRKSEKTEYTHPQPLHGIENNTHCANRRHSNGSSN